MVAGAVAGDDAERLAGEVCDPRVARRPAPGGEPHARPRERPPHGAVGLERGELPLARRHDEAAERRPRRVGVGAEEPLRSVGADEPRPAPGGDEEPPAAGDVEERRCCALDADRLPQVADDGPAGRAGGGTHDRERRCEGERGPDDRALPDRRLPLAVRGPDDLPRARPRVVLAGDLDPLELPPHTCSFSASRPRRRRELTVPRGSSRSDAISPGVYPSR
jgi:hypothetical protein